MKSYVADAGGGRLVIAVRLSRRNLEALLAKLDIEGSVRTLLKDTVQGHLLLAVAEEDESHYEGREPGIMHPDTENVIKDK
jgi:hypothetical protein